MKTLSIIFFIVPLMTCISQNINYEWVNVKFYRPPLQPLDVSERSFSIDVVDVSNQLETAEAETLRHTIDLPGFRRVRDHAAVKVEIVLSGASITSKELNDKPLTIEKDGVKSLYHQYHYLLNCSFPTKLRLSVNGQYIEQDFPAFFQTKYHGRNSSNEMAFHEEYERDYSFRQSMYREKLAERVKEINTFLSSQYGYSLHPEHFSVGYVKDKHNEYADLTRGMALIHELLLSTDGNEEYLDEAFRAKSAETLAIFESVLSESSTDKKARINPKVTAMIHHNLALLSFGLQDFGTARHHLQQASKGSNGTQAEAASLLDKVVDYEKRMLRSRNKSFREASKGEVAIDDRPPISSITHDNYIVGKQNDTLRVAFAFPPAYEMPFGDSVWIQDRIIIDGEQRQITLGPQDIRGFCRNGIYYEALWWVDDLTVRPWTTAHQFCKEIVRGEITVFACHEVNTDDEGHKSILTNEYYNDGSEGYKQAMFLSFKRGVSKLVADYPELSERVRNGEFTRDDFVAIVRAYNEYKQSHADPKP